MATAKGETMCIVEGKYMLPSIKAAQLIQLLAEATVVTRDYVSGRGYVYKFGKEATDLTFSPLTMAQVAAMNLED